MQQCFLIDDEPIFNLISSKVISRSGWPGDVRVFISAKVALEEIKSHVKQEGILPSIIFLDIRMPEMDGLEAAREIRALPGYRTTPIIALSADAFEEDRAKSFEAGMNAHLVKPVGRQLLFSTLLKWMEPGKA